jgi:hypothetical protein
MEQRTRNQGRYSDIMSPSLELTTDISLYHIDIPSDYENLFVLFGDQER